MSTRLLVLAIAAIALATSPALARHKVQLPTMVCDKTLCCVVTYDPRTDITTNRCYRVPPPAKPAAMLPGTPG